MSIVVKEYGVQKGPQPCGNSIKQVEREGQSVRAQGCLSAVKRGRVTRMRAMVVPGGITTLVSGWVVRSVQPKPSRPAQP